MGKRTIGKLLRNVTNAALYSRLCILLLQFVFNALLPDHESDGFITPAITIPKTASDEVVDWLLGGLLRWDAQYFIHIAVYEYVYENSLAFFPGFPVCIKIIGQLLQSTCSFLNVTSIYLISSVLVNVTCFVLSVRTLFRLTYKEFQNEQLAHMSSLLFCINPASIFFTAPYSESLFSFLSFSVMLSDNLFTSCIFVALSALVRSNGVINLGFPLYKLLKKYVNESKNCFHFLVFFNKLVIMCAGSLSTFIIYQFYCYSQFCTSFNSYIDAEVLKLASLKSYVLRGSGPNVMCNSVLPYLYVQSTYWNVGFLYYFQFKQIPNFAVAFPILYFASVQSYRYFIRHQYLLRTLGLLNSSKSKTDEKIFVYVVHLCALLFVCLFFVHIQISTRLLCSSSPALYWFCAKLMHSKVQKSFHFQLSNWFRMSDVSRVILVYCVSYCVIGTALFCNSFPWT